MRDRALVSDAHRTAQVERDAFLEGVEICMRWKETASSGSTFLAKASNRSGGAVSISHRNVGEYQEGTGVSLGFRQPRKAGEGRALPPVARWLEAKPSSAETLMVCIDRGPTGMGIAD